MPDERELSPREEVRQLADAMYDRRMSPESMRRLDELIADDLGCLQAYVERIDFHGEILNRAQDRRQANQAASAVARMVRTRHVQESRQSQRLAATTAACVLFMAGLIGWMAWSKDLFSSRVGVIAGLTSNVPDGAAGFELGQILRKGYVLSLDEGIATLQLPHVLVDVIGPARLKLKSIRQIELQSGSVHAVVQKGGEGFSVRTQDSEVVDLGTEFVVTCTPGSGTEVNVRRGRVQTSLFDWRGVPTKVLELTDNRAATFLQRSEQAREIDFKPKVFQPVDLTRGGIRSIDGALRTAAQPPVTLQSNQLTTPNHMLVVPERQDVVLEQDLVITGLEGPTKIPAGSTLSSYLIHYDPTARVSFAPRGAVTYFGRIATVLVTSSALHATDATFGLEGAIYDQSEARGLELPGDEIRISNDRKTISYFFGVDLPSFLDEARVLVVNE